MDVPAPTLSSSTVDATGEVITLTFAEALLKAQADSAAIKAGFTVKVGDTTIDASKITGTQNGDKTQVILTLADDVAIGTGQNVTVGYAKSAGNHVDTDNSTDARVEVADFFATVASSSSLDVTAPTLSSSTLDASTTKVITLTFAEALRGAGRFCCY